MSDMQDLSPSLDEQAKHYDEWWTQRFEIGRLNALELARVAAIFGAFGEIDREYSIRSKRNTVCDLGCGRGWFSAMLSSIGDVTGVDLSPQGIEQAKKLWPHIAFECANILEYRPAQQYDLVVSSEVIEHIEEQEKFALTVSAITKPGGFFVLTCPNARAKPIYERAGLVNQPVENWPTRRKLKRLFSPEFEIIDHRTFAFDFTYLGMHRYLSAPKLLRLLRRLSMLELYNGVRSVFDIGLHQLLVARRRG